MVELLVVEFLFCHIVVFKCICLCAGDGTHNSTMYKNMILIMFHVVDALGLTWIVCFGLHPGVRLIIYEAHVVCLLNMFVVLFFFEVCRKGEVRVVVIDK